MGLLGLGACASLKAPSFIKPMTPNSSIQVRDLGAVSLSQDWMGSIYRADRSALPDKTVDYPWRGRAKVGAPIQSYVAPQILSDNRVLLALLGEGLQMRDLRTGALIWKYLKPLGVGARALVLEPYVYVANMNSEVSKLRLDNGEEQWTHKLNVESTGGIAVAQGVLFVSTADNAVWALDEKTGNPIWTYRRPTPNTSVYWSLRGSSTPVLSIDGGRVFVGFADGTAVALRAQTGDVVWERSLPSRSTLFKDFDLGPLMGKGGAQIFLAQADGDLVSLNTADGSVLWRRPLNVVATPTYDTARNLLFVASLKGEIHAVSANDGSVLWTQSAARSGLATSLVPFQKDKLLVTWTHGPLSIHSADDGSKAWESVGTLRSLAPASTDDARILVLSTRNELHRFAFETLKD